MIRQLLTHGTLMVALLRGRFGWGERWTGGVADVPVSELASTDGAVGGRSGQRATLLALAFVVLAVGSAACSPIVNAGYVSLTRRTPGEVDIQVGGGGGLYGRGDWWLALHAEPYVTPELSIPVGGLAMGVRAGAGRVGVRYRYTETFSVGAGFGGGVGAARVRVVSDSGGGGGSSGPGYGLADLEFVAGHRWDVVGLSFAFRPTMAFPNVAITLPAEFGLAFYVDDAVAITLMLHGGWQQGSPLFFGGGAGLAFNF